MSAAIIEGFINGFDLCSIQDAYKPVDFAAAKSAGFDFVYIKSSQYSRITDGKFSSLRDRAIAAGLAVGAYHFCSHDTDPVEQAEFFYRASEGLGSKPGELPPMLDWEFCTPSKYVDHPAHCVRWIEVCASRVTQLWYPNNAQDQLDGYLPRKPTVYTYPNYSANHQPALSKSDVWQYPLCYASYTKGTALGPGRPVHALPLPWDLWALCQHKGNDGRVPGVAGACDMQVFNGTSADFALFRGLNRKAGPLELGPASQIDEVRAALRVPLPRERRYESK